MKTVRKNHQKSITNAKHENISSLINEGLNIDAILSELSNSVFGIDKESRYILEILAIHGPLNEYEIDKLGNNYNLNRFSIRRRIYGTNLLLSLLDFNFITITDREEHKTGKEIKKFTLTFKGLMAVVSTRIKFEQIHKVKNYFNEMYELTSNTLGIIDVAILYSKYHLALIMLWCKMNRLNLDRTFDVDDYFLEGITNNLLRIGNIVQPQESDWSNYILIGIRYFTLKHTLISIIKKIHIGLFPQLDSNPQSKHVMKSLKRKHQNPVMNFLIRYLIKDWVINLEVYTMQYGKKPEIPLIEYGNDQPFDEGVHWITLESDADVIYDKIAKSLGLKRSKVKMLSHIKYKERTSA